MISKTKRNLNTPSHFVPAPLCDNRSRQRQCLFLEVLGVTREWKKRPRALLCFRRGYWAAPHSWFGFRSRA
jgi:hypothetical protein